MRLKRDKNIFLNLLKISNFIFYFSWRIAHVGRKFRNTTRSMNWLSISLIIRSLCNQHTNFIPHSRFFLLPFARSCFSDINKHMPIKKIFTWKTTKSNFRKRATQLKLANEVSLPRIGSK